MTTTEVSASWPDCALGLLCPFLDVSAVSGSIVAEAVVPCADWAESLPGLDCGEGVVVEAGEQPATASAHVPTPARKTAGFFMDCTPIRSRRYEATSRCVAASNIPQR